ncbi:SgcJ/EcaC family oxidoreductase [Mesorhizobium denitrificans]|uniref:SgcJ/EcaC family oxidoreductase n=1 Tax=Mesorhizobium denitrificans TaxID=2294114 RepID=A0A371X678_9HYPH|nr:SgcJ/EcaC family oxidoreductase [Mesorhizobium denitrificans]RFC64725.1 SgcJ/EcaC family oxidoreductase [Mesorhizobium denitrificans]
MSPDSDAGQATQQIVDAFVAAWNTHDAEAFAAIFADDADFTNVFGMKARGRASIEQFHRPIFETMFKDSHLEVMDTQVRPIRPDVIALDMHWSMLRARDPVGNEWPKRHGLISVVVAREQDAWTVVVMHNMDLPEDGMAEAQCELHRPSGATILQRRQSTVSVAERASRWR